MAQAFREDLQTGTALDLTSAEHAVHDASADNQSAQYLMMKQEVLGEELLQEA
jgi:hypothetical protein